VGYINWFAIVCAVDGFNVSFRTFRVHVTPVCRAGNNGGIQINLLQY